MSHIVIVWVVNMVIVPVPGRGVHMPPPVIPLLELANPRPPPFGSLVQPGITVGVSAHV